MIRVFLLLLLIVQLSFSNTKFNITTDFPKENKWLKPLLQNSIKHLNKMFLNPYTKVPKVINVTIKKDIRMKSISANASRFNTSINFKSNLWQKDKYRIWIMIHELTNLMASYYGSNSYPSDWWANGRSPFPEYISVKIMEKLGFKKEAFWRKKVHLNKSDHKFYWHLDKKYGIKIFKKFFALIKSKNINLSKIGKPWPNPSKKRSLITLALLSIASGENLANTASYFKIGTKPKDWHLRHPEIKFIPYSISKEEIKKEVSRIEKL